MTSPSDLDASSQPRARVVVSILNWNNAQATLECLHSLRASMAGLHDARVVVLDNGSEADDVRALRDGLPHGVQLIRLDTNVGFAAGHNVVMREAIRAGAEYVWLLNNDTTVSSGVLQELVCFMDAHPRCGAASPVLYALHDASVIDFCGACHDTKKLRKIIPRSLDAARQMEISNAGAMSLYGTALLLRTAALQAVGLLNEDYFAYYEDDDLSRRLSQAGWENRMCFDAALLHRRTPDSFGERPAYYFYLMARNDVFFWGQCGAHSLRRRLNRLHLVCRSLIRASRLRSRGLPDKSDACLLGLHHGLIGQGGAPCLEAQPPRWMVWVSRYVPRFVLKAGA